MSEVLAWGSGKRLKDARDQSSVMNKGGRGGTQSKSHITEHVRDKSTAKGLLLFQSYIAVAATPDRSPRPFALGSLILSSMA